MIINAAYEGPPYPMPPGVVLPGPTGVGCYGCRRGSGPFAGRSLAGRSLAGFPVPNGILLLSAITVAAIGLTLYSFNGGKKSLAGSKRKRRR